MLPQSDRELWERMKPYALMDEDFMRRMDERQIEGVAFKIVKWVFGILLASVMLYAPAKVVEWFTQHVNGSR